MEIIGRHIGWLASRIKTMFEAPRIVTIFGGSPEEFFDANKLRTASERDQGLTIYHYIDPQDLDAHPDWRSREVKELVDNTGLHLY